MCDYLFASKSNKYIFGIDHSLLDHRGTDDSEEVNHHCCRARHWRLCIQELTSYSNQPFFKQKKISIYNGELYSFRSIGGRPYSSIFKSETEFLFNSLESDVFEAIKKASGRYSFLDESFLHENAGYSKEGFDFLGLFPGNPPAHTRIVAREVY